MQRLIETLDLLNFGIVSFACQYIVNNSFQNFRNNKVVEKRTSPSRFDMFIPGGCLVEVVFIREVSFSISMRVREVTSLRQTYTLSIFREILSFQSPVK